MKKYIKITFALLLTLSVTSCGTVNLTKVEKGKEFRSGKFTSNGVVGYIVRKESNDVYYVETCGAPATSPTESLGVWLDVARQVAAGRKFKMSYKERTGYPDKPHMMYRGLGKPDHYYVEGRLHIIQ